MVNECIFCKIVRREIPAKIVHEDEESIAFLDIAPRSRGMTIVVPKKHFTHFEQDRELASKLFDKALIVAEKIKRSLNPLTVYISVMSSQIPHFHIRVYPVYEDQVPLIENKPLEVSGEELDYLARRIKSVPVEWKGREELKFIEKEKEEKEKKEPEKKKSEEDVYWIKRSMEIA